MASRPMKICSKPGCPNLTKERYCDEHKQESHRRYDNLRGTSAQRGYDSRWRKYRAWYIREHPLCIVCEKNDRVVPTKHVDHIIPVSGPDDPLFWDPSNHQPLCHSCHSRKTVREDGGFGNNKINYQ